MSDTAEKQKPTLNSATSILFHVAAHSHTLCSIMSIEQAGDDIIKILPVVRPWLSAHPLRPNEYSFNADAFHKITRACSDGEFHMAVWLLNVWNPSYAKSKKWNFDLFAALANLDSGNRQAICDWLKNPIWP